MITFEQKPCGCNCFYTKFSQKKLISALLKMQPQERFLKATFSALEIVMEMAVKSLSENICAGQPLFWKYIVPGKISFLEISLGVGCNI